MRIFSYIILTTLLASCGLFKKSTPAPVEIEAEMDQPEAIVMEKSEVCMAVLQALQTGDYKSLDAFTPTSAVVKEYFGEQVKDLSDEELESRIKQGRERLEGNISKLRDAAKAANVELKDLTLKGCLEAAAEEIGIIGTLFLTAEYLGEKDTYKVPMVVLDTPNQAYILEIVKTTRVFD